MDEMNEALVQENKEVDDLCGCTGKEKTMSRRVMKIHHEPWCFYYMHLEEKLRDAMDDLRERFE
jgi:hypothetical protein